MQATTAQPVGADILAAGEVGQMNAQNQLTMESGNPLKTLQLDPNQVLNQSANYAQLSDLQNRNINAQINPGISNLKNQVQQNEINQYQQQVAFANNSGPGSATQQIQNAALRSGLGNVFQNGVGSNGSFGQASLQSALGQGVLGANAYQQNLLDAANSNANGLVASTYGNYTPSGSSLENINVQNQANAIGASNAATQGFMQNQGNGLNQFGQTLNNVASSEQANANQNAAAQNQASAANLGLASNALSAGTKLAGSAFLGSTTPWVFQ